MVAAMCIRQDLPRTSQCMSWSRDGKIYCRRWVDHMLGSWFEIGVGSIIENTQIVFICESLNDFTPGINIMTAPQIIMSNLLKHLPEDTLKILKEILIKIWISADFPDQWRAATVIPIPKPNKDHTDPLSYRPIALTSCLLKVLERMINTRLIWYLEKSRILDRSQCGFRKHHSTIDHVVSLERYLWDAFAQKQQAVGLFFDLEKAYETTWQYGIIRDLHRIGLRGRLPVFVSEYLRDRRIRVRIGTTLSDEYYPEERVPTGGVLAVTCFGLKINELPSCIARDIFRAFFVDDLSIRFRGRSLDTIERHLQQAVNVIKEWATRNGFKFAAHKCKVVHFTSSRSKVQRLPNMRIVNTPLPVEESMKFLGLWWDSHLSFKKHISVLKTQCKEALNLMRVVAHLKWGGDRDTLLMLYRAIVCSKLDYGCIVYGTASNTNLRQLYSIHNSGLRLALGMFCTSPVSSLYTEANEAPLEERRLKLSMHYYVKTRACIDNPAHHALHKFDRTTRDLYAPRPNGRGGMTRPPAPPIGLKVEEAMTSAEINAELVCPLRTPNFPPGTHDYDPKRHDLIEGVSKCMISGQEAQAKFNEFREAQGSHDEVFTDGSKMNKRVGAAAVINRHFQNGETTCRQLSKRLPDNSTIFAAEATAISLALNYYQHGSSPSWCSSLLWLNVLFAGNWGWRHREPFYLQYHEPALVIEWQGHTCSFLLGTKPLWHWRKWKSRPTSKRDPRPRYWPTGKCPLYRYETTGQLLHSQVGSNQVECSCTWQRSLSCETNTGATKEVLAPNQSWRGHPTSNWPYQGHQIPYPVPRTANWLSPLWSNTDNWPYAAGVCIVTGMSWWILHSRLVECSLRDNSWDLHSRIPARSGILLSDMM